MSKIDSIIDFSIILNRGYGSDSDCSYFDSVNHPQLLTSFIDYVNLNQEYIGLTRIENRQSIADSGCDVFIELKGEVRIGVQIKSRGDVEGQDFSSKVKAQFAESSALGLDKFYILICSPINSSSEKKINYIVSHMSTYKTNYHAILNPNNCVKIFNPGGRMPTFEFAVLKQLYSREENQSNIEKVFQQIKDSLSPNTKVYSDFGAALNNAINRNSFQKIESANRFVDFINLDMDSKVKPTDIINSINDFITKLGKLSGELRNLFYLIVKESTDAEGYIDALETDLHELESLLATDPITLMNKIRTLSSSKYKFVRHDEDEPNVVHVFIRLPGDYNFMRELLNFCESNSIDIKNILVTGDFSLLD